MAQTSWMNPHLALIEGKMYRVLRSPETEKWQANRVVGRDAVSEPIGAPQDNKLDAQLIAMRDAGLGGAS